MQKNKLSYNLQTEKQTYLKYLVFSDNFLKTINKKKFLSSYFRILNKNDQFYAKFNLFYGTNKISKYKKLSSSVRINKKKQFYLKLLKNQYFKIKILNRFLKKRSLVKSHTMFKKWKSLLFPRSESLFFDFLKILNLVENNKIEIHNLLYLLGLIFKTLHKRKHSRFMYFVAEIFTELVKKTNNSIKGVKFMVSGRLKGKSRASVIKFQKGRLNLNEITSNVSFSQLHVYTLYGAFGMKLWINYDSNVKK